jgi:hypothetical protein
LIPPSDSDSSSRAQVAGEAAAVSSIVAAAAAVASSGDNEQEPTPAAQGELERSTEARTEMTSDQHPLIINVTSEPSPRESEPGLATASLAAEEVEQTRETPQKVGGSAAVGDDLEAVPNASPAIGELGRQSTIVRASGLLSEDREAAVRARQRARSRSQVERQSRHRKNTDEFTNERKHLFL